MYSEMKKNIENSDAPSRIPTTLAPVSVLIRKMRNGTSGAAERSSIATNAAIRTTDSASRVTIFVEPQPALLASSSAYANTERPAATATAPAPAQEVRGAAAEQQEAAESDDVRVDYPGQILL